jgi:hypothetical protein
MRVGSKAQAEECFPSMGKALGSIPRIEKKHEKFKKDIIITEFSLRQENHEQWQVSVG